MSALIKRRIYLASSWRNPHQPALVARLREAGHEVYDFRNPAPGQKGFAWRDCGGQAASDGPGSGATTIPAYLEALQSDRAAEGYALDKAALDWCDTCIVALPCGRSAHLEVGYAAGAGKDTYVLLHEDKFEPELMYLLNTDIATDIEQIIGWMAQRNPRDVRRWQDHFGAHGEAGMAAHAIKLLREAVELCAAAAADPAEITEAVAAEVAKAAARGEFVGSRGAFAVEMADVWIQFAALAHLSGVDINTAINAKMDVNWQRQWTPDACGVLRRPADPVPHEAAPQAAE